MASSRRKIIRNQGSTLTLKLLRQAPNGALHLDDLEDSSVPLLPGHRQLRNHPDADHTRPCNHDQ
jgi:hypothetical protein